MNKESLKYYSIIAENEIKNGAVEDKLRHFFSTHLINIFPDNPWWIQEHVLGTETYLHFLSASGKKRIGFADSVVGKTAIEYEKNLGISTIFDEGYYQVKEYCAALCNMGIQSNDIYGVLSDTVRWFGYTIKLIGNIDRKRLFGAEDIDLIQQDQIDLSKQTDAEFDKFEEFINKYFDRKESRLLNGKALSLDFGTESIFYIKEIEGFKSVARKAMDELPVYAELIKSVWQNFVAYLGASDYGEFSDETYVNEFYLVTVAKVLCADILSGCALLSSDEEIKNILNGNYFKQKNIMNLVDYDYFGWLNNSPYVDMLIPYIRKMQKQLACYDFKILPEEDLFGELLAQLSKREHRILLGQDFTPHWVAREMTKNVIECMNEEPRMLDMCCGSGVFLIETLKRVREKYNITIDTYDEKKDNIIFSCVMGFDIDPLAVVLAKVNWILAIRDLFQLHRGTITIPVYHADSLFVATPVSHDVSLKEDNTFALYFDGNKIEIPSFLITPQHRRTFDVFLSKCYRLAMSRAAKKETELKDEQIEMLVSSVEAETNVEQTVDETQAQRLSAYALILQLEKLQREGRNGIWYFILNNSYRPGLVEQQFNCIISNPPWLAMSKLADNPYKKTLIVKNDEYGIKPPGAAHLHMELASTFLLTSIDKYLTDGARWMCVMPGSLMSGYNHEPLRREKYINSKAAIEACIDAIWELPTNTFKNKAVILGGKKSSLKNAYPVSGRLYVDTEQFEECEYTLNIQGKRSAWTNKGRDADVIDLINDESWPFVQGADLFPRTVLFHTYNKNQNGTWSIQKIEKTSELHYLVSDSKKEICSLLETEGFSDEFVYDCLISKHISPFIAAEPAKGLIPGRKSNGKWKAISDEEIALMDVATACVFEEIQRELTLPMNLYLNDKINIYGKLYKQDFTKWRWLVLSNAGGSNPCAAYIDMNEVNKDKLIIDQTLYWYVTDNEDEAIFVTAMINSEALNDCIKDFQPEGGFGKRHIHTLPYKIIPRYDKDSIAHENVVKSAKKIMKAWNKCCENPNNGKYLLPNSGSLNSRRRKQQALIKELFEYEQYRNACNIVMGIE